MSLGGFEVARVGCLLDGEVEDGSGTPPGSSLPDGKVGGAVNVTPFPTGAGCLPPKANPIDEEVGGVEVTMLLAGVNDVPPKLTLTDEDGV